MRRMYAGVGLVTLATLLLELLLTRIFSVTLSYHFAFMVISLALFGLGLSGVVLYLRRDRFPEAELPRLLSSYSRRFGASLVVVLLYVVNHSVTHASMDVLTVGRFTWQSFFQLAFLYCITAVPFYYGGMVVSLALYHLRRDVARLYFFDLVGASLACLVLDPVLRLLGAPSAVILVALLAGVAALVFGAELERWRVERRSVWAVAALVGLLALNLAFDVARVGSFKEVRQEHLVFTKWNALSRVEVQRIGQGPPFLTIDGQARTNIHTLKREGPLQVHRSISALVYVLERDDPSALIIGPGGGVDVVSAMRNGVRKLTLAEINPIILNDVMLGEFRDYSGNLYGQPGVRPRLAEGRHFVRSSEQRFDVIQATLVDTWAATAAGAFALTENHLYTVEAFEDYLAHLTPRGVVTMSRWVRIKGMEFVRLCSLARAALERRGVGRPGLHAFAAAKGKLGTLLVKRTPFTARELATLHRTCKERGFQILHSPRGRYLNPAAIVLGHDKLDEFYRMFPIDVRPVYDERPFFFYAVKPEKVIATLAGGGPLELNSTGTVILAALLGLVVALVLGAIVVPLWISKRGALLGNTWSKLRDLLFFVCIGVAFILVEIGLLSRFTLHLGHPTHALRVVLFSLLLFSGLGSLLSGRTRSARGLLRQLALCAGGVAVLMALYAALLGPLLHAAIGWSFYARLALSVALIAPPGLLMGMLLPTAIRMVTGRHEAIVPWAWGLNGAASVCGSVLAMVISIHQGFTATLAVGGGVYLLALLVGLRRPPAVE